MGVYHSALQVGKYEFAYGGNAAVADSGIYINAPRRNSSFIFKCSIPVCYEPDVGERVAPPVCELTKFEIFTVLIPRMGQRYRADQYDILTKNCNHFTDDLLKTLTAGRFSMPSWINRLANIGSIFHCVVPRRYLNRQPVEGSEQADESDVISNAN